MVSTHWILRMNLRNIPILNKYGKYDASYYKRFLNDKIYDEYSKIDIAWTSYTAKEIKSLSKSNFFFSPHIPLKAINAEFHKIIKNAENTFRVSIGLPKVGEGWISETKLFHKVRDNYPNEDVIQHSSPSWLGRQHFDIWIPLIK